MGEKVAISLTDYERLSRDSAFLACLEVNGVDNWSGYDDAQDMFNEEWKGLVPLREVLAWDVS